MAGFSSSWRTVCGVVGGFSTGAAVSVLLLGASDKRAAAAATAAPAAAASDQLFSAPTPTPEREVRGRGPADGPFSAAIQVCRGLVLQTKEEMGIPGVCIAVSVDGETAWTEGFGFADVENRVPCCPNTVMRIASISKSITMTALAKLWEDEKIDLDLPVQHYVPRFPKKTFDGEPVEITTRMLACHLSGIRHWKGGEKSLEDQQKNGEKGSQNVLPEFYLNTHFKSVEDALSVFENDNLVLKPDTKYLYSSPAWTLVSAVMEKAAGITFKEIMTDLCNHLRLMNTRFDENDRIIRNRARYYTRNKTGRLINSPCVDNSCKWAGGGLQSTVGDLVKFGDAMLYCYQGGPNGFLQKDTIDHLWTPSPKTLQQRRTLAPVSAYGLGWVVAPTIYHYGGVEPQEFSVHHTGGAVGASSVLLIVPDHQIGSQLPSGVTVAITVNLQQVGLWSLAEEIAHHFQTAKETSESSLSTQKFTS